MVQNIIFRASAFEARGLCDGKCSAGKAVMAYKSTLASANAKITKLNQSAEIAVTTHMVLQEKNNELQGNVKRLQSLLRIEKGTIKKKTKLLRSEDTFRSEAQNGGVSSLRRQAKCPAR
jgi:peptidoglycan hydrolase CwlO-like protein